jgi:hypothetical protein
MLKENEIFASSQAVKYHSIEYHDNYVVVTQNRTRRRIPNGYFFEDTGVYIYISLYYSYFFQHKKKLKTFIVNKVSKDWREAVTVDVSKHVPKTINKINVKPDKNLVR